MKKFLTKIILFGLVAVTVFAVWVFVPNPLVVGNYFAAQKAKMARLAELKEPKVVLVGGSNLAFGFDSPRAERAWGRPVVNMGLHAGTGLRYQLNCVKPYVRKGDIVLVCPEYDQFCGEQMYGLRDLFYIVNNVEPTHWAFLSPRQIYRNLAYVFLEEPKKAENVHIGRKYPEGDFGQYNPRYCPLGFNACGDMIQHWSDVKTYEIRTGGFSVAIFNPESISDIKTFAEDVRSRGASVYLMPPGTYEYFVKTSTEFMDFIKRELAAVGCPFVIDPEELAMPLTRLYDTPYHLNLDGVTYRTGLVIAKVRELEPTVNQTDQAEAVPTVDLDALNAIGTFPEVSEGLVRDSSDERVFIAKAANERIESLQLRIPDWKSRRHTLHLKAQLPKGLEFVRFGGAKFSWWPDVGQLSKDGVLDIACLLNDTEIFVDEAGALRLGLYFPPHSLVEGSRIEILDLTFGEK